MNEAERLDLDGTELFDLGEDVLAREYNGIGPEFFPAKLRDKVTEHLALFEPAALIHDLRNYLSDGMRRRFHRANDVTKILTFARISWRKASWPLA